jgi:NAD(P)-dependent dehydrogenase (short-subunit alcohol dehydrogenase family)
LTERVFFVRPWDCGSLRGFVAASLPAITGYLPGAGAANRQVGVVESGNTLQKLDAERVRRTMGRLTDKVAILTGSASGIGRATATLFSREGARVAILDRNAPAARETAQDLRRAHAEAQAWEVDLADGESAEAVVSKVAEQMGRIDVLVNNAATYVLRSFDEMTRDEWQQVLDTNLTAYFLCARAAARAMPRQGGSIINISSVHRMISEPNSGAYAASKGGVAQLTRNLAIEFAPRNIVVNSISPGFIRTPMSVVNGVDETTTPDFVNTYVKTGRIPLGRAGLPEEIAAAALFLASRECSYLTGADLVVDGGLTITL